VSLANGGDNPFTSIVNSNQNHLSLEAPGPILSLFLSSIVVIRRLVLRYLGLPRPRFLAIKAVDEVPNSGSGLYNFNHFNLRPWYIKPTFWSRWGPISWLVRAIGGKIPGNEKYHPHGYDLRTIGPELQIGKGLEEMDVNVELLKVRSFTQCPFSSRKSRI